MQDKIEPVFSMPFVGSIIVAVALLTACYIIYMYRSPGHRVMQIIGALARRADKRPKLGDLQHLMKVAEREGCQEKLRNQMNDIHARFGENQVRCGHLAAWWFMVINQVPWTIQLPGFASKSDYHDWMSK